MAKASGSDRQNLGDVVTMSLLRAITSGLGSLFRKEQGDRELDEELRGFLQMAVEEKMKQGMSRKDALRAVRLERGSLDVAKEEVRSAASKKSGFSPYATPPKRLRIFEFLVRDQEETQCVSGLTALLVLLRMSSKWPRKR
jgi:hypothetical protein